MFLQGQIDFFFFPLKFNQTQGHWTYTSCFLNPHSHQNKTYIQTNLEQPSGNYFMIKSTFTEAHSFQNSSLFLSSTHFTCPSYGIKHILDRRTSHNTQSSAQKFRSKTNIYFTGSNSVNIYSTLYEKKIKSSKMINQKFSIFTEYIDQYHCKSIIQN